MVNPPACARSLIKMMCLILNIIIVGNNELSKLLFHKRDLKKKIKIPNYCYLLAFMNS